MKFGVMFFANGSGKRHDKYQLMVDAARLADESGMCAVWTPERHFDNFGSIFPNPAITSAALATITEKAQLRAGSLISPLHDTLRVAEEWAMIDNLSHGRAAVSFGAGWNINDFVFYPDRYNDRHSIVLEQVETVRRLWRGESIVRVNSAGREVEIFLQPAPIQEELPVWITSSGKPETFAAAGKAGANILTHLIGQNVTVLAEKIKIYRDARETAGFDAQEGIVSLMLHTFLDEDADGAREKARRPLMDYLRSAVSLEKAAAAGGGVISGGHRIPETPDDDDPKVAEELLALTCERYMNTASLIGSRRSCSPFLELLERTGVNEIACLVDYGLSSEEIIAGLEYLGDWQHSQSSSAVPQL